MSTRANIIIKDKYDELIFYRHSDGYPEGTMPTLEKFLDLVKTGKIRNNVGQSAGWLIVIGADEYDKYGYSRENMIANIVGDPRKSTLKDFVDNPKDWKVGAYEPTTQIHGDIDFLYVIDLESKQIHIDGQEDFEYSGKFS